MSAEPFRANPLIYLLIAAATLFATSLRHRLLRLNYKARSTSDWAEEETLPETAADSWSIFFLRPA
jgi:hypothetical protein